MTIADGLKNFFNVVSNIFTVFTVLLFVVYVIVRIAKASTVSEKSLKTEEEEKVNPDMRSLELANKHVSKLFFPFLIIALITWFFYVVIPTKKECIQITLGGGIATFLTTDSSAKEIPSDVMQFMHLYMQKEINELTKEDKAEVMETIGANAPETEKEKLLKELGNMTKDEILEWFKNKQETPTAAKSTGN